MYHLIFLKRAFSQIVVTPCDQQGPQKIEIYWLDFYSLVNATHVDCGNRINPVPSPTPLFALWPVAPTVVKTISISGKWSIVHTKKHRKKCSTSPHLFPSLHPTWCVTWRDSRLATGENQIKKWWKFMKISLTRGRVIGRPMRAGGGGGRRTEVFSFP